MKGLAASAGLFHLWEDANAPYHRKCEGQVRTMKWIAGSLKALLIALLVLALPAQAQVTETVAKRHMIAAANPHAAQAGLEMMRAGGSAVDAAIATQMVLGLVE